MPPEDAPVNIRHRCPRCDSWRSPAFFAYHLHSSKHIRREKRHILATSGLIAHAITVAFAQELKDLLGARFPQGVIAKVLECLGFGPQRLIVVRMPPPGWLAALFSHSRSCVPTLLPSARGNEQLRAWVMRR